jgi:hypothetical protein
MESGKPNLIKKVIRTKEEEEKLILKALKKQKESQTANDEL